MPSSFYPNARPQSTRLVTASEDDASPIIMLWDLRNARAPEKVGSMTDRLTRVLIF
jgi:hypothetical protein